MKSLSLATVLFTAGLAFTGLAGCKKDKSGSTTGVNIYSVEDDKKLGAQVAAEVEADPNTIVLSPQDYPIAYQNLNRIVNNILNSGAVTYKDEFDWRVRIIKDDNTLNAFAAPGGYIYVYTGIIKFLQSEDAFAVVMGHEMAHADRRHVTQQLTKQYGLQLLLDIALGSNQNAVTDIAAQLATLSFSRSAEKDADETSVAYLCGTDYKANGAAIFFETLLAMGQAGGTPVFLSTHPSEASRVEDINAEAMTRGCDTTSHVPETSWTQFQASLP